MRQKNAYYKLNDWGVVVKTARVANKEDACTNDLFLFAFCFGKCLSMSIFSSHLWQRSQLARGRDERVLAGVREHILFSSTHRMFCEI